MPYRTKRNNADTSLIRSITVGDYDGKEFNYQSDTGFSRLEKVAADIFTGCVVDSSLMADKQLNVLAAYCIKAAHAFFDELERPAREQVERMEAEYKDLPVSDEEF